MTISFPAHQPLDALTSGLADSQKQTLQRGEAIVSGQAGTYVAQILIQGTPAIAWQVLTDFENLAEFLPNVIATQVLEVSEHRTVVEQTNLSQILFAQIKSRVRTENIVTGPGQIDFHLLAGDLNRLQGSWQVLPLSHSMGSVLIRQVVSASANQGLLEGSFHIIFREALKRTLTAIQQEVHKRQALRCAA